MIKTAILINPSYRGYFDRCVTLFKDLIQKTDYQHYFRVTYAYTGGGGGSFKVVAGRCYTN